MAGAEVVRPGTPLWLRAGVAGSFLVAVASAQGLGRAGLAAIAAVLAGGVCLARPEYGVVALTATFLHAYPVAFGGSGWLTVNNVLGLLLGGVLLVRVVVDRDAPVLRDRYVQLLLLIGLAAAVNLLVADRTPPVAALAWSDGTRKATYELLTKSLFAVFLVSFIRTRRHVLLLVGCVVALVLLTAPDAAWKALTGAGKLERIRAAGDLGIAAAANANRLAFVCAMTIAIVGHALIGVRSRLAAAAGGLTIAGLVLTVFLTASRSGFLSLVVLVGVFLLAAARGMRSRAHGEGGRGSRWRRVLVVSSLAAGVLATAAVIPHAYLDRITNFLHTERDVEGAGSLAKRWETLQVGLRMLPDRPLTGAGIGDFRWVAAVEYGSPRFASPHNSYLLTLAEGGLLLFVPYLLLFLHTWRDLGRTQRLARRLPEVRLAWLVDALRTVFALLLAFSFFADFWDEVFLYLVVGLSAVVGRLYRATAAGARPGTA